MMFCLWHCSCHILLPTFGFIHSSSTCLLLCSTTLSLTQNDVLLMAHQPTFGFISSTYLLHCSTTLSLTQIDVLLMAHLHNFGFILLNIICFLHYSAIDDMIYTLFDFSDQYILHTSGLTHALADFVLAFCNLYASMPYVHMTICIILFIFATSLNLFCFQKFIYNYILHLFLLFYKIICKSLIYLQLLYQSFILCII